MFKNSGKKIMWAVNALFILNVVLVVLALAALGLSVFADVFGSRVDMGEPAVVFGLGVAAGILYLIVVYFALLGLYAFGELVQNTVETRRILAQMQTSGSRVPPAPVYREPVRVAPRPEPPKPPRAPQPEPSQEFPAPVSAPEAPAEPVTEAVEPSLEYRAPAGAPVFPVMNAGRPAPGDGYRMAGGTNLVFCPKCGAKHDVGTSNCRYCGAELPGNL